MEYIYDKDGKVISKSKNLRGIRRYVATNAIEKVMLFSQEAGIRIVFKNGDYWKSQFADYSVLRWMVSNWRNIYGASLIIDNYFAGVVYKNHSQLRYYIEQ